MFRLLILVPALLAAALTAWQEPASQENVGKRIEKIREYIAQAGNLYKEKDYEASGKKIKSAQSLLIREAREGNLDNRELLEKEYRRIAKAHELLIAQGIELPALEPLPDADDPDMAGPDDPDPASDAQSPVTDSGDAAAISFKSQIAPLLVQHCGNCHIRSSKGKFSMATFESLTGGAEGGATVMPGKPDASLVVTLMADGEMPPRDEVPQKDIDLIRQWVQQGAPFDGDDPSAKIGGNQGPGRKR
jgi:mono/diheme cytochrome c family protein